MKTIIIRLLISMLAHVAQAQIHDGLLPGKGRFNTGFITTYTGKPGPVFIADVTYGVSQRTSVGLVGGTTGMLALVGARLNSAIYEKDRFRALFQFNGIYYPERNGAFLFDREEKHVTAWMFSLAIVDAEWRTQSGVRIALGAGALETHCIPGMMNWLRQTGEGGPLPFKVFTAAHIGAAIPLSSRITLRPEVVTVMQGLALVEPEKFMVEPINPYINLVYSFGR